MEQLYMIEVFVDKVTVYASEEDEKSGANKKLIVKAKFGPKVQFIIKEGQLAPTSAKDDIVNLDENQKRKWTRTIRVGKSYLFPTYPDTLLMILNKFPLELEVWNDDENEIEIYVGVGKMIWETEFYHMLKETTDPNRLHEPLSIKQNVDLFAECCCKKVGEIEFILRLSTLGAAIITEFQQLMADPDTFVFRTDKAPSMFQCKRIEGDNPNFCMVGSIYETTTLEDPTVTEAALKKINVCTTEQSCGGGQRADGICEHPSGGETAKPKKYPIDKIRMGDITGPCGNSNCVLAQKVKNYIRALEAYKKQAGKIKETKDNVTSNICGACCCKDDRHHRDKCPDNPANKIGTCEGCGGLTIKGETCGDKKKAMLNAEAKGASAEGTPKGGTPKGGTPKDGTPKGTTPKGSNTQVMYVFSVTKMPDFGESIHGRKFLMDNFDDYGYDEDDEKNQTKCCESNHKDTSDKNNMTSQKGPYGGTTQVYNANIADSKKSVTVYQCIDPQEDRECKCNPPKPSPPCRTFDCECLTENVNIAARKAHKPFCPLYKHKATCPVLKEDDEEEEEEDEVEPLPYGLPPVQLGPCPVIGKPCTYPDGFARMYKTAALTPMPPSHSEAGKVCCSKEYERIKKAIKEYMQYQKDHDYRCINKYNVDTERRCCDKEQALLSLMGRACCGSHKMAIQPKKPEEQKK